jgi:glycosyltransferase involved in cell wall biosynthesis
MRPTISHLIAVHNGARYLAEAIASLRGELVPGDEIIVSDDGSTDDSVAVAEACGEPVRVLRGPKTGPAGARNRALAAARCDWICMLDADDLALPGRIALLGARLLAPDAPDLVYGAQRRFVSPELIPRGQPLSPERDDPPALASGTLLAWRRVFDRMGGFNENLRVGELLEWTDRARVIGLAFEALPVAVMRRRRHETNLTANGDYRMLMLEAVRHALRERQRQAGTPPASSPGSAP